MGVYPNQPDTVWPWSAPEPARFERAKKLDCNLISSKPPCNAEFISSDSSSVYRTSLYSCTCPDFLFRNHRQAPCKHIMSLALQAGFLSLDGKPVINHSVSTPPVVSAAPKIDSTSSLDPFADERLRLEKQIKHLTKERDDLLEYKKLYQQEKKNASDYRYNYEKRTKQFSTVVVFFVLVVLSFLLYFFNQSHNDVVTHSSYSSYSPSSASTVLNSLASTSQSKNSLSSSRSSSSQSSMAPKGYVWISSTGIRYHDSKKCSGMYNPKLVTLSEAKSLGYTPCGTCDPPR